MENQQDMGRHEPAVLDASNAPSADAEPSAAFTLDASGYVGGSPLHMSGRIYWSDLTPFMQGYVEAAFADLTLPLANGDPIAAYGFFRDLAPATLSAMMADCERFLSGLGKRWIDRPDSGAEFWRRRQEQYWPGSFGFRVIKDWPRVTLYLGDDGLIYQRVAS